MSSIPRFSKAVFTPEIHKDGLILKSMVSSSDQYESQRPGALQTVREGENVLSYKQYQAHLTRTLQAIRFTERGATRNTTIVKTFQTLPIPDNCIHNICNMLTNASKDPKQVPIKHFEDLLFDTQPFEEKLLKDSPNHNDDTTSLLHNFNSRTVSKRWKKRIHAFRIKTTKLPEGKY
jgi:hypothetical protein